MIVGTWQIVQWCPDLTAREWLNIGVGFKEGENQHFKFLDNFQKVECLYSSETKVHLIAVIELVERFFSKGLYEFSPQLQLLEIGFSRAKTVEEGLNRTFEMVVTLRGECE